MIKLTKDIPNVQLYRFFTKSKYQQDFLNGNVRFGWQEKYKHMCGDVREDATEGVGYFMHFDQRSGTNIDFKSISGNTHYLLCCSAVKDDLHKEQLASRFGVSGSKAFAVKIDDLRTFTAKVLSGLIGSPMVDCFAELQWIPVEYTEGYQSVNREPDEDLHLKQKPREYKVEAEWRLVLRVNHPSSFHKQCPLELSAADYDQRIASSACMDVKDITPGLRKSIGAGIPRWIDDVTLSINGGLQSCCS